MRSYPAKNFSSVMIMNRNNQTYHGQKIVISFVEFFHPKTFSWQKFFLLKIFQDELVISYYPTCFINNVIVSNVTYLNEFICDVIDLQQYLNQTKNYVIWFTPFNRKSKRLGCKSPVLLDHLQKWKLAQLLQN